MIYRDLFMASLAVSALCVMNIFSYVVLASVAVYVVARVHQEVK